MQFGRINRETSYEATLISDRKNVELIRYTLTEMLNANGKKTTWRKVLVGQNKVTIEHLEELYNKAKRVLAAQYPEPVTQTSQEKQLKSFTQRYSRAKVHTSTWIANHCVDLFVPSVGLVVEVNGWVHYREGKMKKDAMAGKRLIKTLGLHVQTVENWDTGRLKFSVIDHIKTHNRLSSRQIKNMWRDIYIETIARTFSVEQLNEQIENFSAICESFRNALKVR